MLYDVKSLRFEAANWVDEKENNHPCLFTDVRIDRNTVPDGWFTYEVRDCDCSGDWCEIARNVMVNFWGSIIMKEEIDFESFNNYVNVTDYFYGEADAELLQGEWKIQIGTMV